MSCPIVIKTFHPYGAVEVMNPTDPKQTKTRDGRGLMYKGCSKNRNCGYMLPVQWSMSEQKPRRSQAPAPPMVEEVRMKATDSLFDMSMAREHLWSSIFHPSKN